MTHESVWNAIECFAASHNLSCSGLARISGMDSTTFNKSKRWSPDGKPRWPSTQSLAKILTAMGSGIEDFTKHLA
jgi:phage repressor protein C with HTH and peptisase S24 domain